MYVTNATTIAFLSAFFYSPSKFYKTGLKLNLCSYQNKSIEINVTILIIPYHHHIYTEWKLFFSFVLIIGLLSLYKINPRLRHQIIGLIFINFYWSYQCVPFLYSILRSSTCPCLIINTMYLIYYYYYYGRELNGTQ